MVTPEAIEDAAAPLGQDDAAPALPPGMPPANEPGFPSLPMFGGGVGEALNALSPQTMFTFASSPLDGVMTTAMALLRPDQSLAQIGTQYLTRFGTAKAELMANGMLQTAFEGLSPLPFLQLNTTLAWSPVPAGLAGGIVQGVVVSPIGMLMACVNTGGQMSTEFLTGIQPTSDSQLMFGLHSWSLPGVRGGIKAALEWQHQETLEDQPFRSSAITLACTVPFVRADGSPLAESNNSTSLSVFHQMSQNDSMFAMVEWNSNAAGTMTVGGTRKISEHGRVRGKWNTAGVLALALEVAGDKCALLIIPAHMFVALSARR